ncbi:phosphoribosylanthranilate isomerase [Chryseobacterium taiwanense]|uniref:N-(5'-phosphoribosyl)anthranilate isomerase n=1 Tax=Chryseobacterium taiwanense TaxID=363331 RepID=A0A0B4DBW9_9FLAO|nr:phosphoribosylanthranilate isomerase [Chryseobacterium taiwanense]KIC64206.1 phosphoribosylanthranilate isomerase [Chryseobacterium taiwanense]
MNNQLRLKVCGLTRLDQIQELISLNTDFLGFIYYEKSPRYVLNHLSLEEISKINHQGKVGVFVNETLEKIVEITERANLNIVQLHGDENEIFISTVRKRLNDKVKIIKAVRIDPESIISVDEYSKNRFFTSLRSIQNDIAYLLFDTDSKAFGGTGKQFDWCILNEIEIPLPYFLSGGISEQNIDNLKILNQQPFSIDINSKFELEPGVKDLNKIRRFYEKL